MDFGVKIRLPQYMCPGPFSVTNDITRNARPPYQCTYQEYVGQECTIPTPPLQPEHIH